MLLTDTFFFLFFLLEMFVCKGEIGEQRGKGQKVVVWTKCVSGCVIMSWSSSDRRRRNPVVLDTSNVTYETERDVSSSLTLMWYIMITRRTTRRWWKTSRQWWMSRWCPSPTYSSLYTTIDSSKSLCVKGRPLVVSACISSTHEKIIDSSYLVVLTQEHNDVYCTLRIQHVNVTVVTTKRG